MRERAFTEYFYGDESEQFIFFRIPRQLIVDKRYRHVSTEAKLLYGMLLDRMGLSAQNDWYDAEGRVYIYYTVDEICADLNCGRDKAMKLLAELDSDKGIGLIERARQGQGKPESMSSVLLRALYRQDLVRPFQRSIFPTCRSRKIRPK